jgi:hypothetical protein
MTGSPSGVIAEDVQGVVRGVGHRIRRDCNWGLLIAAESAGRLYGRGIDAIRRKRVDQRSPPRGKARR